MDFIADLAIGEGDGDHAKCDRRTLQSQLDIHDGPSRYWLTATINPDTRSLRLTPGTRGRIRSSQGRIKLTLNAISRPRRARTTPVKGTGVELIIGGYLPRRCRQGATEGRRRARMQEDRERLGRKASGQVLNGPCFYKRTATRRQYVRCQRLRHAEVTHLVHTTSH